MWRVWPQKKNVRQIFFVGRFSTLSKSEVLERVETQRKALKSLCEKLDPNLVNDECDHAGGHGGRGKSIFSGTHLNDGDYQLHYGVETYYHVHGEQKSARHIRNTNYKPQYSFRYQNNTKVYVKSPGFP